MNPESRELRPQIPKGEDYKLDKGKEYKVFKKECAGCGKEFTIHVPNREAKFKFRTKQGEISVEEMEAKARSQEVCPDCEKKQE